LFAQSHAKVFGKVTSSENVNLIGVNLSLHTKDQIIFLTTDTLGKFTTKLNSGLVKVVTNHVGYLEKKLDFDLKNDTIISIVLENDISILKEIVVTNNSKKAITSLSGDKLLFNLKELNSLPTILGTTDIIKILQLMPGVQNSGDANGYLYVRGGDPGHNSILYGGTPIYGMAHLLGIFPFYNSDHIKEVEFDKSSSNAKYGGRLSSTTLLIPNKKAPSEFTVQGNIGLLASQVTLSIPITKKSGFFISGRKTYLDEIVAPIVNSISNNNDVSDMKYGFSDSNFTFVSEISKNNLLTIDAFLSSDKLKIKDANISLGTNLKWGNFTVSPTLDSRLSSKVSMSNSFFYTQYNNALNMEQSTIKMSVSSFIKDYGFTNSIRFLVKETSFESGFQYVLHNLEPQKIEIKNLSSVENKNQNNLIKSNESAFFLTAKPKLFENFIAELGIRVNYYTPGLKSNSFLDFQPRINLNYYSSKKLNFYATYAKQNQYLNLITTSSVGIPTDFWIASSDGIKSQSSNEFSFGSNQVVSRNINSSFGVFYRSMKNLLEYPYGITQFNEISTLKKDLLVGKGEAYGFEMMVRKNNGNFKGWLSYTLSWSNRDFDALNNGFTYFAKYDRRHNLSLVGTYDLNFKWNFGITQIFSSGNHFTIPTSWYFVNNNPVKEYSEYNNAMMPNYIRTDFSVNYFFIKNAKKESALNFSIFNTFNIENPIYVVMNVTVDKNKDYVVVKPEKKVLFKILPSISWRFKF
jgi:hypothetical protein